MIFGLVLLALVGSVILLAASSLRAQAEDIYKWVDGNNQTQYTQMPPPHGIQAIRIQSAPPPASATQAVTAPAPEPPVAQAVDKDTELTRLMEENCNIARKNLELLNKGGNIQYRTPDGELIRLTEKEHQQRIDETNAQIKLLCKN
jgi:hypothetical protein